MYPTFSLLRPCLVYWYLNKETQLYSLSFEKNGSFFHYSLWKREPFFSAHESGFEV